MLNQVLYFLKRVYHFFKTGLADGLVGEIKYGFPARKLTIITITGTDGKTTSSTLLYHTLRTAGKKVGLISTVAAYIKNAEIDTGFHVTSPKPSDVQKFMREMVEQGLEYLVLETTSHGIYQYRTWGINPTIAGVTNISHEHLDYHLTYEQYVEAKSLILKRAQTSILNEDDQSFSHLKKLIKGKTSIETYSIQDRLAPQLSQAISERFPEKYNQSNARLVVAITQKLGLSNNEIAAGIRSFSGVPGRMEEVKIHKQFRVYVDFAHTPKALESALIALKSQLKNQKKPGKLIAVFGCAGLRDRRKRPMMGEISTRIADLAIFTAEDPRTENIWSILRQMKENLTENHRKIISIPDRRQAIDFAITKLAQPGDIIGIFGKGHEQSMCYGTTEYPWDDRQVVLEVSKHG